MTDPVRAVLTDGPPAAKAGAAGLFVLLSTLWEHAISLAAACMLALWVCDMLLGILRAVDEGGPENFLWPRFWEGVRKFGAAVVVSGMAVTAELLAREAGVQWFVAGTAMMAVLGTAFFFSALKNANHFFPHLADTVFRVMHRGVGIDQTPRNKKE